MQEIGNNDPIKYLESSIMFNKLTVKCSNIKNKGYNNK
jgi:hypothetical protein